MAVSVSTRSVGFNDVVSAVRSNNSVTGISFRTNQKFPFRLENSFVCHEYDVLKTETIEKKCESQRRRKQQSFASVSSLPETSQDWRQKSPSEVNVLVVGPTGYIGKFVTKELISRGYKVIAGKFHLQYKSLTLV